MNNNSSNNAIKLFSGRRGVLTALWPQGGIINSREIGWLDTPGGRSTWTCCREIDELLGTCSAAGVSETSSGSFLWGAPVAAVAAVVFAARQAREHMH